MGRPWQHRAVLDMAKLVIWGAGGHGKVLLDCALATRNWCDIVFVDDNCKARAGLQIVRPVLPTSELPALRASGFAEFIVAVGDNVNRARCYDFALTCELDPATVIHPTAFVSGFAHVGAGTVVMPLAAINADAHIGVNCIINTSATVEHDCVVGDHSHIAPGARLGGAVVAGAWSFVGMNASVLPLAEIGDRAIVGAGSVVLKSVRPGETVVGNPARVIAKKAPCVEGVPCS